MQVEDTMYQQAALRVTTPEDIRISDGFLEKRYMIHKTTCNLL